MLMIVILLECLSQRKCGDDKETIKKKSIPEDASYKRANKDIRDFTRSGGGSSAAVGGESGQHPQTEGSPN